MVPVSFFLSFFKKRGTKTIVGQVGCRSACQAVHSGAIVNEVADRMFTVCLLIAGFAGGKEGGKERKIG